MAMHRIFEENTWIFDADHVSKWLSYGQIFIASEIKNIKTF